MTGSRHDAQVKTLTAEVRTLVVGSRQVTMSVYSQLDEVDYDEIEPFGRVSPKGAEPAFICTVGRAEGCPRPCPLTSPARAVDGRHARRGTPAPKRQHWREGLLPGLARRKQR